MQTTAVIVKLQEFYVTFENIQKMSGMFTMQDCKNINRAHDALVLFFSNESSTKIATKEVCDSVVVLTNACNVVKNTAKFGEVSIILQLVDSIECEVNKYKTLDVKLQERKNTIKKRGKK